MLAARAWLDDYTVIPLYIACIALPAYALANVQDGIARSYDWVGLGIVPTYIVRQLLLTVLMAGAYFGGLPVDAVTAMVARRRRDLAAGARPDASCSTAGSRRRSSPDRRRTTSRLWIATALPILMAEGFYLLLTHTDVLMLQQFRSPEEVAVYYAAVKTLALVAFIYFSIAATTAHRVSAITPPATAKASRNSCARPSAGRSGRRSRRPRAARLRQADARAVRPAVHRRLSPDVHPRRRAPGARRHRADGALPQRDRRAAASARSIYGGAFAINLVLCFVLIPPFGATGAAIAISAALIVETIALFVLTEAADRLSHLRLEPAQ